MSTVAPSVPLSEVLQPISRREAVDPEKTYNILGAHWYAKGLYTKDVRTGAQVQAKYIYRVEEGDFVYNRLFAWKGSFAVATAENNACYVSGEFPCFTIIRTRAEPRYVAWYFQRASTWNEALGLSAGGTPTSRNRLRENRLLGMRIPLPSIEEQRRLAVRIEEIATNVEEAQGLRVQSERQRDNLMRSILFDSCDGPATVTAMRSLVRLRSTDVTVQPDEIYHFAGVYSFGRGVFTGNRRQGAEFAYTRLTRLRAGNFVYPKLMAWEGALGTVPSNCDGLVVSPEFPVFEVDESRVLPEVLDVYFRTPSVWPKLSNESTGTNVRRRRLHPSEFLRFEMPLPPMPTQLRLRAAKRTIETVTHLQSETRAELDALLPSVLDRAFDGAL